MARSEVRPNRPASTRRAAGPQWASTSRISGLQNPVKHLDGSRVACWRRFLARKSCRFVVILCNRTPPLPLVTRTTISVKMTERPYLTITHNDPPAGATTPQRLSAFALFLKVCDRGLSPKERRGQMRSSGTFGSSTGAPPSLAAGRLRASNLLENEGQPLYQLDPDWQREC
jgi:hypothetical protein